MIISPVQVRTKRPRFRTQEYENSVLNPVPPIGFASFEYTPFYNLGPAEPRTIGMVEFTKNNSGQMVARLVVV